MAGRRKMYVIVQHVVTSDLGLYAGTESTYSGSPVMAFDSEERAIGHARKLEQEARRVLPPFYAGQPDKWSSQGLKKLVAQFEKHGLRDLPDPAIESWKASRHWQRWWDQHGGELTPEQVEAIWKLLDQVELYRVVEVPIKD